MARSEYGVIDINERGEFGPLYKYSLLETVKSKYQEIRIGFNEYYGHMLILDGEIQLSESDEFIYHESLVQPAMHIVNPEKVLILGGGDGCVAREVLKHSEVKKITLVDIDEEVVHLSKKYLKKINKGSLNDPKLEVVVGDAMEYIKNTSERYDLIISDIVDPNVLRQFYEPKFYQLCKRILNKNGMFVTQGGNGSINESDLATIERNMLTSFKYVRPLITSYIPSFGAPWTILMAADSNRLDEYKTNKISLRYMSPELYRALGVISKTIKNISTNDKLSKYTTYEFEWQTFEDYLDEKARRLL